MSEKRFTVMKKFDGSYVICDNGKMLVADDCCDLLNESNKDFEDCEKLLDSKDDFIHKFKRDIEELGISIKLFEDDIATKDKKIEEQQATIQSLKEEKEYLVEVINKNLLKGEHELSIKHKEAKDKMKKGGSSEVSPILDVIFYWTGYRKALVELKEVVR